MSILLYATHLQSVHHKLQYIFNNLIFFSITTTSTKHIKLQYPPTLSPHLNPKHLQIAPNGKSHIWRSISSSLPPSKMNQTRRNMGLIHLGAFMTPTKSLQMANPIFGTLFRPRYPPRK